MLVKFGKEVGWVDEYYDAVDCHEKKQHHIEVFKYLKTNICFWDLFAFKDKFANTDGRYDNSDA